MRINLGRVEVIVPQNFLYGFDVHAILQHQRRRRMAQLVGGVLCGVDAGHAEMFFDQRMHGRAADALVAGGEEEGVFIASDDGAALCKILGNRCFTRLVQINNAHFVAFAQHAQCIVLNIAYIEPAELGNTQSAI